MKKIIMSLFIAVVAITSCSKDEASTELVKTNSNLLIRLDETVTTFGSTNVESFFITLKYDGNKLTDIKGNDGDPPSIYTYTGNLITKVKSYDGPTFTSTTEYFYNSSNKLTSNLEVSSKTNIAGEITIRKSKIVYTYNQDGTILEENFKIDNATGLETKENTERVYTYANDNMVKRVKTFTSTLTNNNNGIPTVTINKSITTDTFEYDNKKNPLTNVLGFRQFSVGESSSVNNVVKETSKFQSFTNNVLDPNPSVPTVREYTLKYNANDYPIEETYIFKTSDQNQVISSKTRVSKYFYE